MSRFTQARFEPTEFRRDGRRLYRCVGGLVYEIGYLGSGIEVCVPNEFVTDGPSMPKWIINLAPRSWIESLLRSSAVHDMMREDHRFTKIEGDAVFLSAMHTEKTPSILREVAFLLVRLNDSRSQYQDLYKVY